jgi:hypothetical protein
VGETGGYIEPTRLAARRNGGSRRRTIPFMMMASSGML